MGCGALNTRERLGNLYGSLEVTVVYSGQGAMQYTTGYNRKTDMNCLQVVGVGMGIWTGCSFINVKAIEDGGGAPLRFLLEFLDQRQCCITLLPKD